MFACFFMYNIVVYYQPFLSEGSLLHKDGKGEAHMTNAELILQLVDKLLKQKEEIETLKSTK